MTDLVGDHPGGVKLVGRPSRRSATGWEIIPGFKSGRRPSRRFRSGRETIPKVRKLSETIPEVWNWSGDHFGGSELVWRPSRRSGSVRETLQ